MSGGGGGGGGAVDILIHHPNFEIDLDDRLIGVQGCWCVGYGWGQNRSNFCRYKQKNVNKQRQFSCIKQREMTAIIMTNWQSYRPLSSVR